MIFYFINNIYFFKYYIKLNIIIINVENNK